MPHIILKHNDEEICLPEHLAKMSKVLANLFEDTTIDDDFTVFIPSPIDECSLFIVKYLSTHFEDNLSNFDKYTPIDVNNRSLMEFKQWDNEMDAWDNEIIKAQPTTALHQLYGLADFLQVVPLQDLVANQLAYRLVQILGSTLSMNEQSKEIKKILFTH